MKEILREINVYECKEFLKKTIEDSISENTNSLIQTQKSILDLAFEIDADFAEELVKMVEKKERREMLAKKLKSHLKQLKVIEDFSEGKLDEGFKEIKEFVKACDKYAHQILTQRVKHKHLRESSSWLSYAHKLPISETFSIYMLYVINANHRFESSEQNAKVNLLPIFHSILKCIQMIKVLTTKLKEFHDNSKMSSTNLIKIGQGEIGHDRIERWVSDEVVEYLKICDPYFDVNELDFIKTVLRIKPDIRISILSTMPKDPQKVIDDYQLRWNNIFDQQAPEVSIVWVGFRKTMESKNILPTHDRHLITIGSGLRLGGSLNGLGKRNSEISEYSRQEAEDVEKDFIDPYLLKTKKDEGGIKVNYFEFNL